MGSGGGGIFGYKYYLGVHFALAHGPVDKITNIIVDKRVVWKGDVADGRININNPDIFGGESREGGIAGPADFCNGGPDQLQNDYLVNTLSTTGASVYVTPADVPFSSVTNSDGYVEYQILNGTIRSYQYSPGHNEYHTTITLPDGSSTYTHKFMDGGEWVTQVTHTGPPLNPIPSDVPAFRGVACLILRQCYVGMNPYMKKWAFRLQRIHVRSNNQPQWYDAKAQIGIDMNPAHIIHECLTDNQWGMGYLTSDVDEQSFVAAADKLYAEDFGLSILWDKESTIENFIAEVIKHIDGSLYVDRVTGLFKLRLIRDDYVVANLPVFDESNIVSVEDYACSTFTELTNSVTVNYWEATYGITGSVTVQDVALVQLQGGSISQTVTYGGVSNSALATRLASRDLKVMSTPITRCAINVNRYGSSIVPGDAVKVSWPDFGVIDMVMRVASLELGTAADHTIKITLVQDVFSLNTASYMAPPLSNWVSPISDPTPITYRKAIEAPYYLLVRKMTQNVVDNNLTDMSGLGYALIGGVRPSGDTLYADAYANDGSGFSPSGRLNFCPTATSSNVILKTHTSCQISRPVDFNVGLIAVGDLAIINDEIVRIDAFSTTSLTFARGCLDTVPLDHPAGSRFLFMGKLNYLGASEYVYGESIQFKLLTATGKGPLPIASAPADTITFNDRAIRPYPPGNLTISGSHYPETITDMPITATWVGRNRVTQTGATVISTTEGNVIPESGTTYELRLYNNDTGSLLYTKTTTALSDSAFPALSGLFNLRLELWSVRNLLASFTKHSHVFIYSNINYINTESSDRLITEDGNRITSE